MQYVLTEEEYQTLVNAKKIAEEKLKETIQDLCIRVCDSEPVNWGWGEKPDTKPWKCIWTIEGTGKGKWYH